MTDKTKKRLFLCLLAIPVALASIYLTAVIDAITLNTTLKRLFVFAYFCMASSLLLFLRNKYLGTPRRSIRLVGAIVAVVLVLLLPGSFLPTQPETTISLQASGGEVWLTEVVSDGQPQALGQLELLENLSWEHSPEYDDYVCYSPTAENSLTFSVSAREVSLKFAAAPWCGQVELSTPAGTTSLDLRLKDTDAVYYTVPAETVQRPAARVLFSAGAAAVLAFLLSSVLQLIVRKQKRETTAADEQPSHPQRSASADLLRIVALLLVVSVHFFLHNGFYQQSLLGPVMFFMTVLRTVCMTCVPLFLMLSGYLLYRKTLSRAYYNGLGKTLLTYLLVSLVHLVYKSVFLHQSYTFWEVLTGITSFTMANYAWYIEMYLGLFLLVPFINLAYHGVGEKRNKQIFLGTLIVLTALPGVFNALGVALFPDWWITLYPVTYYVLGAYIREFGFCIKRGLAALAVLLCSLGLTLVCFLLCESSTFVWDVYQSYEALPTLINAVMIFGSLITLETTHWSPRLKTILRQGSNLCLGAYLLSFIFDNTFYPILNQRVPTALQKLPYMPLMVLTVLLCSLGLSWVLDSFCRLMQKVFQKSSPA